MTTAESLTSRFLIVAPLDSADLVNATLRNLDPTGETTAPAVPLRLATDTTNLERARYGSWAMTDRTNRALKVAVRDAGWRPTRAEQTVYADGTPMADADSTPTAPLEDAPAFGSGQRVWMFDGDRVDEAAAFAHLGLARFRPLV